MRIPNAVAAYARNAANNADLAMFSFTVNDRFRIESHAEIADAKNIVLGTGTGTMLGTSALQKLGLWGKTPVSRGPAWTITNVSTDRSYDANATTIDELADALGTLVAELQNCGALS